MRQFIAQLRHDRRIIPILAALLIGSQSWQVLDSVGQPDNDIDVGITMMPYLSVCDPLVYPARASIDNEGHPHFEKPLVPTRAPLKWWLNCVSSKYFNNYKFLPVLFNLAVMPLVYLLAVELSRDRIIGLIAISAFLVNPLYTDWVSNGTYDNVWSFFLLLSVYLSLKAKNLGWSVPCYLASIAAKSLSFGYLPAWVYSLWHTNKTKKAKVATVAITCGIMLLVLLKVPLNGFVGGNFWLSFNWEDVLWRNVGILWQVLPVLMVFTVISTTFTAKTKPANKRLVVVWMLNIIFLNPFIMLFSEQATWPYRFVPLAAFMSIFIGMVIVEAGNCIVEARLKKQPLKNT